MAGRGGRRESVTSVRRLRDRDRTLKALEMRKIGLTWEVIAEQAGYKNRQSAYQSVMRFVEAMAQEPSDQVRKLELERLDMLWSRAMPGVGRGDPGSIGVALRIMERRAKLLGLDAPVRTEVTGADGGPLEVVTIDDQTLAGAMRILISLGLGPAGALPAEADIVYPLAPDAEASRLALLPAP